MAKRHILILGGTTEARVIAGRLSAEPGLRMTTSLAGRTESPVLPAGEVRSGGFGGAEGLARWLGEHRVDVLVDATHPFAARISANARQAALALRVPLVSHERPAWAPTSGDHWLDAASMEEAAELLGEEPRRAFLAVGRQELAPFDANRQHHYVVRTVEPIADDILPDAVRLLDRGPFAETAERGLLEQHRIDVVVTKNSGGKATYAKLTAARALGLDVVMVRRPGTPAPDAVHSVEEAVAAVHRALAFPEERGA
jgi:precorrin-6A/cobalt-precorrin-6A reductase